jgi:hypothetical protein
MWEVLQFVVDNKTEFVPEYQKHKNNTVSREFSVAGA